MTDDIRDSVRHITEHKYARMIALATIVLAASAIGVVGYRWYRTKIQENAQKILAEALDSYALVRQSADEAGLARAESMFREAYTRSKGATLAPIALVYEADAQARQGKLSEATATLNQALQELPKNSPFYELYEIKKLLIELDASCAQGTCESGVPPALEHLEKIAYNKQARYRHLALQNLIDYYSFAGRAADAQKASDELEKMMSNQEHDVTGSLV